MINQNFCRSLLLLLSSFALPVVSHAGILEVNFGFGAPPPLLEYQQPACPSPGFIWTPGYWAFDSYADQYFWVPGSWVEAPEFGLLWTPGYWDESSVGYMWHDGYWATDVGFYGGIDYGFGYSGNGFVGGYWHGRDFIYNRAVANVTNLNARNVYSRTIIDNSRDRRVSFNGVHGVHARPSYEDLRAQHEPHRGFTETQRRHADDARAVPAHVASANRGRPGLAGPAFGSRTVSAPPMRANHGYMRAGTGSGAQYPAPPNLSARTGRQPGDSVRPAVLPRPVAFHPESQTHVARRVGGAAPQVQVPAHVQFRPQPVLTMPQPTLTMAQPQRPSAPPQVAYHSTASPRSGASDPHRKGRPA